MLAFRTKRALSTAGLTLACALGLGLLAAPGAGAHIYWLNNSSNTIGRANLNGTSVNQSLIPGAGGPYGLAVGGGYVYWSNPTSIGRANLDGTGVNQNFITGAGNPNGIAVDGAHVYWANNGTDTIGRANLNGTGVNQNFIAGASNPVGVAVNGAYIYWANSQTARLGRANLDGTAPNQNFTTTGGGPDGVAIDGRFIYWANLFAGTIGRANLNGTGPNQNFITGASTPHGLAVDGQRIYWGNSGDTTIGRANVDGTAAVQNFLTTDNLPHALALTPLETAITQGPLGTVGTSSATFAFLASESAGFECRLDAQPFAACASPKSYVGIAPGTHTLSVRARDSAGNVDSTPATRSWTYTDATKPRLTKLALSRKTFRASSSGGAVARAVKKNTKITYTLDEAATVKFTVERRRAGRKVNGKCRAKTSKNRKRKKCDLALKGSFKNTGAAGKNSLTFRGRLNGKKLKPGKYYLVAVATDASKNTAKRKKIAFKIVKR